MKKLLPIALVLCLLVFYGLASTDTVVVVGQPLAAGTPTPTPYTCVGYASTACVPDSNPATESAATLTRTYTRQWTATEGGTAISINAYITAWTCELGYIRLYKQAGGTGDFVLVGQVDITTGVVTTNTWNKITLAAFGAQNLNFSSGDVLNFGVAWYENTSSGNALGRNDAAGTLYSSTLTVTSTAPDPITTWTETTTRDMALILEYDPV